MVLGRTGQRQIARPKQIVDKLRLGEWVAFASPISLVASESCGPPRFLAISAYAIENEWYPRASQTRFLAAAGSQCHESPLVGSAKLGCKEIK
jgi:hypothetical protein